MGFYLRKSISAGPLRFNLSKSGIGMSAGVKGLRVGTGPRGSYVRAGRGGVYYRQTLGTAPNRSGAKGKPAELPVFDEASFTTRESLEQEIDQLVDSSGSDLVKRISEAVALKKPSWFANPFSYKQRKANWQAVRACPVFYELDDELHAAYERVVDSGIALAAVPGKWYDASEGQVFGMAQNKGNAGASGVVDRVGLAIVAEPTVTPSFNFEPLVLVAPTRRLWFLPDQMLVQQGKAFAGLNYAGLRFDTKPARFITSSVPAGVTPVGMTWLYVNAKGGPDKRYKENPQRAVLQVWELDLIHDASKFQFHTAFSDEVAMQQLVQSLEALGAVLPATS